MLVRRTRDRVETVLDSRVSCEVEDGRSVLGRATESDCRRSRKEKVGKEEEEGEWMGGRVDGGEGAARRVEREERKKETPGLTCLDRPVSASAAVAAAEEGRAAAAGTAAAAAAAGAGAAECSQTARAQPECSVSRYWALSSGSSVRAEAGPGASGQVAGRPRVQSADCRLASDCALAGPGQDPLSPTSPVPSRRPLFAFRGLGGGFLGGRKGFLGRPCSGKCRHVPQAVGGWRWAVDVGRILFDPPPLRSQRRFSHLSKRPHSGPDAMMMNVTAPYCAAHSPCYLPSVSTV